MHRFFTLAIFFTVLISGSYVHAQTLSLPNNLIVDPIPNPPNIITDGNITIGNHNNNFNLSNNNPTGPTIVTHIEQTQNITQNIGPTGRLINIEPGSLSSTQRFSQNQKSISLNTDASSMLANNLNNVAPSAGGNLHKKKCTKENYANAILAKKGLLADSTSANECVSN